MEKKKEVKIGGIIQVRGLYQCVVDKKNSCESCAFHTEFGNTCSDYIQGICKESLRKDKKPVVFKQVIRVNEDPVVVNGKEVSLVRPIGKRKCSDCALFVNENCSFTVDARRCSDDLIYVEIGKLEKDMIEGEEVTKKSNNLRPFNLEEAKAGKPVCTRSGREVRIICFDRACSHPIVALIGNELGSNLPKAESVRYYLLNGLSKCENSYWDDLVMAPEKEEKASIIPFDLEKAKSGNYRVQTRSGLGVRIVCWDMKKGSTEFSIVGLVTQPDSGSEVIHYYDNLGKSLSKGDNDDLTLVKDE